MYILLDRFTYGSCPKIGESVQEIVIENYEVDDAKEVLDDPDPLP